MGAIEAKQAPSRITVIALRPNRFGSSLCPGGRVTMMTAPAQQGGKALY
jgi:hypothetical protein